MNAYDPSISALKRRRANTIGDTHPPPFLIPEYDLRTAIDAIPASELREMFFGLASSPYNPSIAYWVRQKYHVICERERSTVIDFQHHSSSVWRELNITHDRKSGSYQYEAAGEVTEFVTESIQSIQGEVTENSSWGTKKSALETLRKIGKSVCLSDGVIGKEVKKDFGWNRVLEDAMYHVVECMAEPEREAMCRADDGRGPFTKKMEELVTLCAGEYICETMQDVLDLLAGNSDAPEGSNTGEDEGENEVEEDYPSDSDHYAEVDEVSDEG